MEEEKFYTIILRHDESTKWMINDPILALGEYGVEDDTHRIKRGDGKSKWSELNYEHFGLEYMITYANLQGKVEDNEALKSALDTKISYEVFNDIQNSVVAGITINSEDGKIGKITKTIKDVATAGTKQNYLLIQSEDQSIQGFWSIDETGMKILDLKANASIDDYEPKRKYYVDQICFYDNKLYRAITDFEAGVVFNPEQWVILASLHSSDIRYDNKISSLESKTVKTALDELKDLDDEKVQKTRRPYKVYGTNEDGEQMLYDKDELRTVDSVNGIEANPTSKNIQIDADDINYDDEAEVKQSIREVLDSKVDKAVADLATVQQTTGNVPADPDTMAPTASVDGYMKYHVGRTAPTDTEGNPITNAMWIDITNMQNILVKFPVYNYNAATGKNVLSWIAINTWQ